MPPQEHRCWERTPVATDHCQNPAVDSFPRIRKQHLLNHLTYMRSVIRCRSAAEVVKAEWKPDLHRKSVQFSVFSVQFVGRVARRSANRLSAFLSFTLQITSAASMSTATELHSVSSRPGCPSAAPAHLLRRPLWPPMSIERSGTVERRAVRRKGILQSHIASASW